MNIPSRKVLWECRGQILLYEAISGNARKKRLEFTVYTFSAYLCGERKTMKTLSLKLDDKIFDDTEEMTAKLKLARNRYINEAVSIYNLYNKRRLLKSQLLKESKLASKDSMDVLHEFEKLIDED